MTMSMTEGAVQRYAELSGLAVAIGERLLEEVDKLGYPAGEVALQSPEDAVYRLDRDPSNATLSLIGEWRDRRGIKLGELRFHADGSFFVEQDVARPHPRRAQWFVEAVSAWGRDGTIRSEARLLPMPE
jgi:hypothetical protein